IPQKIKVRELLTYAICIPKTWRYNVLAANTLAIHNSADTHFGSAPSPSPMETCIADGDGIGIGEPVSINDVTANHVLNVVGCPRDTPSFGSHLSPQRAC
ncbi:MAG: hypothetical protein WAL71_10675, partial [Terriglobales bacterium]